MGTYYGGDGSDTITPYYVSPGVYEAGYGTLWPATTSPGDGDDLLSGGWSFFNPYEGAGNDWLDGGAGNDVLYGGLDDDVLIGGVGNDVLYGGDGTDTLLGEVGDDALYGGEGDDWLDGGTGVDRIDGGEGNDIIRLGDASTRDFADGGQGIDNLDLNASTATVSVVVSGSQVFLGGILIATGFENFRIQGGSANDMLVGGAESSTLVGNGGNDLLAGGLGEDVLVGGAGNDTFQFNDPSEGADSIQDFGNSKGNNDTIEVSAAGFGGGLVAGTWLDRSQFVAGFGIQEAQDTNDRFIFNTADGTLWFDSDGIGKAVSILVADLQAGVTFTANDIYIA